MLEGMIYRLLPFSSANPEIISFIKNPAAPYTLAWFVITYRGRGSGNASSPMKDWSTLCTLPIQYPSFSRLAIAASCISRLEIPHSSKALLSTVTILDTPAAGCSMRTQ